MNVIELSSQVNSVKVLMIQNCYTSDFCGKVIHDLTSGLNVKFTDDSGFKAFRKTFDNFNLNCDIDGILLTKFDGYNQCDTFMNVDVNDNSIGQVKIEEV